MYLFVILTSFSNIYISHIFDAMFTDPLPQFKLKFNLSLTDTMRNSGVICAANYDETVTYKL